MSGSTRRIASALDWPIKGDERRQRTNTIAEMIVIVFDMPAS